MHFINLVPRDGPSPGFPEARSQCDHLGDDGVLLSLGFS
jgi:hypothetical protein